MEFNNCVNIGYARESSDTWEQKRALEQQIARLQKAGVEQLFVDEQSGGDNDRPEFLKCVALLEERVRQKLPTRLTITRPDRITRRNSKNAELLELLELGVEQGSLILDVLDMGGPQDLTNPYLWEQFASAGVKSEFELKMLRMRVRRGIEHSRSLGKAPAEIPWGFSRSKDGKMVPDREALRLVIETFLECKTLRSTGRALYERHGITFDPTNLRRLLLHPALEGHTRYYPKHYKKGKRQKDEVILRDTHEAVLMPHEAREIRAILEENSRLRGRNYKTRRYPLQGLVYCSCGHKMTLHPRTNKYGKTYNYLYCIGRRDGHLPLEARCQQKTVRLDAIVDQVIDRLVARAHELIADLQGELEWEATGTPEDPEIRKLEEKLERLKALRSFGDDPAIEVLIGQTERDILNRRAAPAEIAQISEEEKEALMSLNQKEIWLELSEDQEILIKTFKRFCDRVVVTEGVAVVNFRV